MGHFGVGCSERTDHLEDAFIWLLVRRKYTRAYPLGDAWDNPFQLCSHEEGKHCD